METRSKRNRRDEAPDAAQQSTKEPQQGRGGKAPRGAGNKGPGHAAAAQKDKQIAGVSTSPPAELPAQAQAGRVTRSGRGASGSQPPQQPVKGRRTRTKAQEAPAAEVQSKAKAEATAEATEQQGVPGSGAAAAEQQKPNPSGRGASAQPDQGRGMANRQGRSAMDEDKVCVHERKRPAAGEHRANLIYYLEMRAGAGRYVCARRSGQVRASWGVHKARGTRWTRQAGVGHHCTHQWPFHVHPQCTAGAVEEAGRRV